ncbi:MAG: M20/M25/M40 family metallo-hydrolase, partial [Dehalococcoidia bacterium]
VSSMDASTQERVLRNVDQSAMVDLASELIKFPSFKTEETLVARWLEDYFQQRDYQVDLQEIEPGRFQTIATIKGAGGGKSLMLNGHLDINSLALGWKRDPWTPSLEGDRLYGHGVQNMKGAVASIIAATEAIRTAGVKLKGDLVIACVAGETQGGEGTYYLVQHGPRTDVAVVAEPFGLGNITTVHTGIVHMAIHTYGVSGHMRHRDKTVNAVHKMTSVIEALQRVQFTYTPREDLPAMPMLNIGSIIGGRGQSYVLIEPPYVPDLCTIMVDVHFLPGQTVDGIVADIRCSLDPLVEEDPQLKYEIEIPPPDFFKGRRKLVMDPLDVPADEYIVQVVARNHERVMGRPPNHIGATLPSSYSADDTCHLWNAGIPCLIYGPGVGQDEDSADAYSKVSEMVDCARVYALTALEVCGVVEE